ncbi:2'-5' RNA ligase family protein [Lysobacter korlensis]|uniref:2'-5' RNA ligase family protein n=1 Tax=Lysobacter korlensis TaxID=553636 RepID=A0ABV6RNA5_9GAMM
MQSLELLFDPATEAQLRAEWTSLQDAGLPSSARNTSPSNRPHVTVAVAPEGLDRSLHALRAAVGELLPMPITIGGYLVFPSPRGVVLCRSIVVSRALLELHARVNRAVTPHALVLETARVDAWTPHATIARRLSAEQLGAAIAHLPRWGSAATVVGLRLWDSETKTVTPAVGSGQV